MFKIITLFVSGYKNLPLVVVLTRNISRLYYFHISNWWPAWTGLRTFCSTVQCLDRRFLFVPCSLLWLSMYIFVFASCIWLRVCRLHLAIWLICFDNSRTPSSSLVTSISIILFEVIRSLLRTQLCCFQ